MKHVIPIAIGLLLNLLTDPVIAQTTYYINGRVTDAATGAGIPFPAVGLKGTTAGTPSDADGQYRLITT